MLDNAKGWSTALATEFNKPYMQLLTQFLQDETERKKKIYPHSNDRFKALEYTPLDQVKVVILGQDPYHQPNQAHGLCFSVQKGIKTPPSLVNIYKELQTDLGITPVSHGCLEAWAKQGVLLLNTVLTVEDSQAGSHQGKGWEQFTDRIIEIINTECDNVVFLLWGSHAQKKGQSIDAQKHLILKAPHPSPLSAYRGFFGCRHFSKANSYLVEHNKRLIDWQLPEII